MTVTEYLEGIKQHAEELRVRQQELKSIREALDATGVDYTSPSVKHAGTDSLGAAVARAIDFENAVKADEAALIDERLAAIKLIRNLDNLSEREVLVAYYLANKPPDAIASSVGYSRRRMYELRRRGLENLAPYFSQSV